MTTYIVDFTVYTDGNYIIEQFSAQSFRVSYVDPVTQKTYAVWEDSIKEKAIAKVNDLIAAHAA